MKTFSYFDYGLTPSYQCTVDAKDIEDANRQVDALGFPRHRLTAVLGAQIKAGPNEKDWVYLTLPSLNRKEALQQLLAMAKDHSRTNLNWICYQYPISGKTNPALHLVPIEDLKAEAVKYDLLVPPEYFT